MFFLFHLALRYALSFCFLFHTIDVFVFLSLFLYPLFLAPYSTLSGEGHRLTPSSICFPATFLDLSSDMYTPTEQPTNILRRIDRFPQVGSLRSKAQFFFFLMLRVFLFYFYLFIYFFVGRNKFLRKAICKIYNNIFWRKWNKIKEKVLFLKYIKWIYLYLSSYKAERFW